MKKMFTGLLAAICLLPVVVIGANVSSAKVTYEMYQGDILFAQVEETFTVEGGKYHIESAANAAGMLSLVLKDRITRISKGNVASQGLKPEFYEEKRIKGDKEKVRSARFDWENHKVKLHFDDKTEEALLEAGTQDWASLFYQFQFMAPKKETVKVTIADGKKVESYLFRFADEVNVTTAAGKFETLHYVRIDDKSGKKTEVWLAKDKAFFPIRLIQEEDGKVLEQRVVGLQLN